MQYLVYLSSFLAVYRYGSFSKAANSLYITQPAISKHLKILENRLNQKLFTQEGRGVRPTDFAHHLALSVSDHIDKLNSIVSLEDKNNTISISLDFDILNTLTESFFDSLSHCYIFFNTEIGERVKLVEEGKLDFAISRNNYHNKNLKYIELFKEKHILVGTPKWQKKLEALNASKNTHINLQKLNWVISNEHSYFVSEFVRVGFKKDFEIIPSYTMNILKGVMDLVLKGVGVSVLPDRFCKEHIASGALVELYKPEKNPDYGVYLIFNPDKLGSANHLKAKNMLVDILSESQ
tara:strand:+ start:175616 stop:176494 length:879 start_codon:yes stop_codon:yes gene_type:complete